MKHGERLISDITVSAGLSAGLGVDKPTDIQIRNHIFKALITPSSLRQTTEFTCLWKCIVYILLATTRYKAKTKQPGGRKPVKSPGKRVMPIKKDKPERKGGNTALFH